MLKQKVAKFFPIIGQKVSAAVFYLKELFLKMAQTIAQLLGYIYTKFVTKTFQKYPDLVTLFEINLIALGWQKASSSSEEEEEELFCKNLTNIGNQKATINFQLLAFSAKLGIF